MQEKPVSCRNFAGFWAHWDRKFQKPMAVIFHSVFVNLWLIIYSWSVILRGWRRQRRVKEYAPRSRLGRDCAGIVQGIIDGDKMLKDGLIEYRDIVNKSKNRYKWLLNMQTPLLDNIVPGTIKKAAGGGFFQNSSRKCILGFDLWLYRKDDQRNK